MMELLTEVEFSQCDRGAMSCGQMTLEGPCAEPMVMLTAKWKGRMLYSTVVLETPKSGAEDKYSLAIQGILMEYILREIHNELMAEEKVA